MIWHKSAKVLIKTSRVLSQRLKMNRGQVLVASVDLQLLLGREIVKILEAVIPVNRLLRFLCLSGSPGTLLSPAAAPLHGRLEYPIRTAVSRLEWAVLAAAS